MYGYAPKVAEAWPFDVFYIFSDLQSTIYRQVIFASDPRALSIGNQPISCAMSRHRSTTVVPCSGDYAVHVGPSASATAQQLVGGAPRRSSS